MFRPSETVVAGAGTSLGQTWSAVGNHPRMSRRLCLTLSWTFQWNTAFGIGHNRDNDDDGK